MPYLTGVQIRWTGGTHPGMDNLLHLSPKAKPYCGVKCRHAAEGCTSLPPIVIPGKTVIPIYNDWQNLSFDGYHYSCEMLTVVSIRGGWVGNLDESAPKPSKE